ncbi:deiodinase family protein [Tautonia plasticadhaerens]|uniref:Iodothyronine deiodinase n=1 Tax=Tautonia plasticadhaerens TaxID=2527974 RepID=A0A518H6W9_9BACT|nr:deiodinase family protein [Tautonia plasticadhaerens]QDV36613.1 Iodothyronine deiodinase [Tautonia plasticadhaerens]
MRRTPETGPRATSTPVRIAIAALAVAILAPPSIAQDPGDGRSAGLSPEAREFWDSDLSSRLGDWIDGRMESTPSGERPEWLLMFADILQGRQLDAADGWFSRPTGGTRYGWDWTRERFDGDGDGVVAAREWTGPAEDFGLVDADGDRVLTGADFEWPEHALAGGPGVALYYLADADANGKVTRAEFLQLFDRLDGGGIGFLSRDELKGAFDPGTMNRLMMAGGIKGGGPPPNPNGPSKSTLVRGLFSQEIGSLWPGPGVDEPAPDFTLPSVDGDRDVTLSSYQERTGKPVVLIFGNFTCGPFRSQAGNVEKLYRRYRDRVGFLLVYVREAHPTDGWHMFDNFRQGYNLDQPTTFGRRVEVAQQCRATLDLDIPMLVDAIDDPVGTLYSGMPARLYLIDRDGRVAFKSGRGPFGFKPEELEQAIALMQSSEASTAPGNGDEGMEVEGPGPQG